MQVLFQDEETLYQKSSQSSKLPPSHLIRQNNYRVVLEEGICTNSVFIYFFVKESKIHTSIFILPIRIHIMCLEFIKKNLVLCFDIKNISMSCIHNKSMKTFLLLECAPALPFLNPLHLFFLYILS